MGKVLILEYVVVVTIRIVPEIKDILSAIVDSYISTYVNTESCPDCVERQDDNFDLGLQEIGSNICLEEVLGLRRDDLMILFLPLNQVLLLLVANVRP